MYGIFLIPNILQWVADNIVFNRSTSGHYRTDKYNNGNWTIFNRQLKNVTCKDVIFIYIGTIFYYCVS